MPDTSLLQQLPLTRDVEASPPVPIAFPRCAFTSFGSTALGATPPIAELPTGAAKPPIAVVLES